MNVQAMLDTQDPIEYPEIFKEDCQKNVLEDAILKEQLNEQPQTPSKHLLEHQLKTPPTKWMCVKNMLEEAIENDKSKELVMECVFQPESVALDDPFFQENLPSLSPFSISTKTADDEKHEEPIEKNELEANHERNSLNDTIEETEDVELIQEMLPDLYHHARRIIQFLIPTSSIDTHIKKITTRGTKDYKKKVFLLQFLKLTMSTYTKTCYINISTFSSYLSDYQISILFVANAAQLLSELYSPFSIPPIVEDLKQRYDSLYEMDQLLPSLFNVTFWHMHVQLIELRTQLFIHAIWLYQISEDYKDNFQFNEDDELKKYFMDKSGQFKKWDEGGEIYVDACTQRIEKIQQIRQSDIALEALICAFPWDHFVTLMIEFIQKNILNESNELKTNKLTEQECQNIPMPNNSSYDDHLIEHENNDEDPIFSLPQNEEQAFNSENEGEIPVSDIKHFSQIVLDIEKNDSSEKSCRINHLESKYKKSFFDKQQDYQKILWESQNESSQLVESSIKHNMFDEPIEFIEEKHVQKRKKRKVQRNRQSYDPIREIEDLQNITDSKSILKTDTIFSDKSPNISSNFELSNLSPSSPSAIPLTSSQISSIVCKKSPVQPLNSSFTVNENILESTNKLKDIKDQLNRDPYQDYSVIKKHLRAKRFREKKFKPQHRVPWSETEINCLMKAIEEYGSQWSFILSLYGPNGTLSNDLAGRGQVQLKDKARNIKEEYIRARWKLPPGFEFITCKYD